MFGLSHNKLKVQCQLCLSRLKLVRNKKEIQLRKERNEVASLLKQGNQSNARIRVENVIREDLLLRAYMTIENYLLLISTRAEYFAKSKEIPADMVEAVTSLLFASGRVQGDLDEMKTIAKMIMPKAQSSFKQYKEFSQAVQDESTARSFGVNEDLISCLSVMPPPPEEKLLALADIAQEHGIEFDKEKAAAEMVPASRIPTTLVSPYEAAAPPPQQQKVLPPRFLGPPVKRPPDNGDWTTEDSAQDRWPEHLTPGYQPPPQPAHSAPAYISQPPSSAPGPPGRMPSQTGWEPLKPDSVPSVDIAEKMDSAANYLIQQRRSSGSTSVVSPVHEESQGSSVERIDETEPATRPPNPAPDVSLDLVGVSDGEDEVVQKPAAPLKDEVPAGNDDSELDDLSKRLAALKGGK